MSQQNVEVVRAAFEAWNAGDMDTGRELFLPDAIMRLPDGWPEPGPFVGREAVFRQLDQMREGRRYSERALRGCGGSQALELLLGLRREDFCGPVDACLPRRLPRSGRPKLQRQGAGEIVHGCAALAS